MNNEEKILTALERMDARMDKMEWKSICLTTK